MSTDIGLGDVGALALGAGILGTGGGGDPYLGELALRREMELRGPPVLLDVEALPDDALVVPVAMGGAPVVGLEKLLSEPFPEASVRRLERYLGRRVDAVMPLEIGGVNALLPLMSAIRLGVPVLDADGMGRAFPTLDKTTFSILGLRASPVVTSNEHGDCAVIDCTTDAQAERVSRAALVALGGACSSVLFPMSGTEAKRTAIRGSVSLALTVGRAVLAARTAGGDPAGACLEAVRRELPGVHARVLYVGKVVDVERSLTGGFNSGRGRLSGLDGWPGSAEFDFQNEFTRLRVDGHLAAVVPDLVSFVEATTGDPVSCETLRYGQRVKVLGLGCSPLLRSAAGLRACGPAAFGLADGYIPLEALPVFAPAASA